ncbi:agglutinin biogenesis protein MshP [Massilia sp. TS11]|uniref:agglutinin biogenesis protein MshP n=1 Tax=Massilia sp. TS11 TaxID=2908003 RepID=UPI001EDB16D1|nr:agglutinin biogenesis protein MshP [Massilia sp. TS11]MCG2584553.1 agglutinin biogenesis protein MshP [Massilia sp. TS11]
MSLVTAIFLIVVLAGLVAAITSLIGNQQQASGLDIQGARAYQAARAGIEWGLYQYNRNGACTASSNVGFPASSTLTTFVVTVQCSASSNGSYTEHTLTATACNQPNGGACPNPSNSIDYVQRVVRIRF